MLTRPSRPPQPPDDSWVTCWDDDAPDSGGRRAAAAGGGRPLTLDLEGCNSPPGISKYVIAPCHLGGLLDPFGGEGKRIAALKRFEALSRRMRRIVLITLTVDRKKFENPEQAHREACRLVSKFLSERLGIKVWARVLEVQTATGDGWPHWHILADLSDTQWVRRDGWCKLSEFSHRCWAVWRDEMGMGGLRVDLIKSGKGATGYVAKYITKPWPAVPQWMLDRERAPRLIGFSKAASAMIRDDLGLRKRVKRKEGDGVPRRKTKLLHRLAASGLVCKVLEERVEPSTGVVRMRHLGYVTGKWEWLVLYRESLPGLKLLTEKRNERDRLRLELDCGGLWPHTAVNNLRRAARETGFRERAAAEYRSRREALWEAWDRMQGQRRPG